MKSWIQEFMELLKNTKIERVKRKISKKSLGSFRRGDPARRIISAHRQAGYKSNEFLGGLYL